MNEASKPLHSYFGHILYPHCKRCPRGKGAEGVRVSDLIDKYGEDYCLNGIIAKLRCSRCGGKDVGVTFSWDLDAAAERGE